MLAKFPSVKRYCFDEVPAEDARLGTTDLERIGISGHGRRASSRSLTSDNVRYVNYAQAEPILGFCLAQHPRVPLCSSLGDPG